jgi:phage baseplate assembly protein W|tara:strand:+ start:249 stop:461 length:213 start_codon:yes stop_codon:yes gene_type:complete
MNWIQTKAGLQMAEAITRYLPRITVCLEELARERDGKKMIYTEVKDSNLSYVLTEDIAKIGRRLKQDVVS